MRGRTNVGGGGMSINGILSSGIVDAENVISAGDFVEYKTFQSETSFDYLYYGNTKTIKLDNDYYALLSCDVYKEYIGSTVENGQLRLCRQNEVASEILEEVSTGIADAAYYNGRLYAYIVNNSETAIFVYTRDANHLNLEKTFAGRALLKVVDMFVSGSNIIIYGQETLNTISYIKYSVNSNGDISEISYKQYSIQGSEFHRGGHDGDIGYYTIYKTNNYLWLYKIDGTNNTQVTTLQSGTYIPSIANLLVYDKYYIVGYPIYTSSSTAGSTNIKDIEIRQKSDDSKIKTLSIYNFLGLASTAIKNVYNISFQKLPNNMMLLYYNYNNLDRFRIYKFDENGPDLVQIGDEYTISKTMRSASLLSFRLQDIVTSDDNKKIDFFNSSSITRLMLSNGQIGPSIDKSIVRQWRGNQKSLLGVAADDGNAGETIGVYIPDTNI